MSAILSSKTFEISGKVKLPCAEIAAWLDGLNQNLDRCRLVITVEYPAGIRQKDKTAKEELKSLAKDAHSNGKDIWEKHGYCFNFSTRTYLRDGVEIYLTANEALFLFRWLVLNDNIWKLRRYHLYNIRHRLGLDFLKEVKQ